LNHRDFSLTYSFWPHYYLEVDSAPNRTEYQEFLLGGKDGRCVRLNLITFMCPLFKNSANLNFLEPHGPVEAWDNFTFACFIFAPFLMHICVLHDSHRISTQRIKLTGLYFNSIISLL